MHLFYPKSYKQPKKFKTKICKNLAKQMITKGSSCIDFYYK